ncbi:hypothetical protein [Actinospongicola halichondriae]|uniref:hypothetical protein n=1 Tax=Actinospongicola halichondriae TaxID=3236844 RepID=UPI003D37CB2B
MRFRRILFIFAALSLFVAACGDDDSDPVASDDVPVDDATDDAVDPAESGPADGAGDETSTPVEDVDTSCSNSVEVVNAEAETEVTGLDDGAIDVAWTLSEAGPHPANTVDDDQKANLAFATYDIPADEQFGPRIPVGPPGAPEGELFVQISLFNPDGPIAVGQTFVDQIDFDDDPTLADGKINFYAAYLGSDRLLPGDVTVEITGLSDEEICVSLASVTQTDLQTFVGFDGGVVFEREQSLDD